MNINLTPSQPPAATNPARLNAGQRLRRLFRWPTDPKQRRWAILAVTLLVVLVCGTAVWAYRRQLQNVPAVTEALVEKLEETPAAVAQTIPTVPSVLDGLPYETATASRRPLAIMVENHPEARPQFGLSRAAVVYEAIAEGGITRYLGLFGPEEADRVGPVRSARTYYIDWALEYNAIYVHAGGAANALAKLHSDRSINEVDQQGPPVMWRQRRGNEASEHTLYTNTAQLREYSTSQGWSQQIDVDGWKFKDDARSEADRSLQASTNKVTIPWSTAGYKTVWEYDAAANAYKRSLAGKPDTDAGNNQQITVTNLVIQVMTRREITSAGKTVGDLSLYGSGPAWVVQGGQMVKGTWKKEKERSRTRYYNEAGEELTLTPGKTWVSVIQPQIVPVFE